MKAYGAEFFGTFWLVFGGILGAVVYRFIGGTDNQSA
jgi:glycerol uptake facilitator-like aquaporin